MASPLRAPSAWIADGPKETATHKGAVSQVGVVTAVDPEKGEFTLALRREVRLHLVVHPSLLREVRPWRVVQVVLEGTVVRSLRCF